MAFGPICDQSCFCATLLLMCMCRLRLLRSRDGDHLSLAVLDFGDRRQGRRAGFTGGQNRLPQASQMRGMIDSAARKRNERVETEDSSVDIGNPFRAGDAELFLRMTRDFHLDECDQK